MQTFISIFGLQCFNQERNNLSVKPKPKDFGIFESTVHIKAHIQLSLYNRLWTENVQYGLSRCSNMAQYLLCIVNRFYSYMNDYKEME